MAVRVCVRVCPSAHTKRLWLSISTHISTLVLGLSTLVLGLSMLALPVDCLGDFGPRGLSVQYTQDIRGCPPAHTGRPWLFHTQDVCGGPSVHISVRWSLDSARWPFPWTVWGILAHVDCLFGTHSTSVGVRQHTQNVCGCPSAHTGRPWVSVSTHISKLVLGLSTLTLPVDCSGDFGPHGLSVQYTQDVRGCPPAHTGHLWPSVAVRQHNSTSVAVRECPSAHTGRPWLSISTHISTLALPVDCLGDFGPRGLSVQYTQDVRGCPSAHTGRPLVSVSTHRTSVCVRQHTQDVCGCPCVSVCGRPWLSISTHISTLVLGLSMLALPVNYSGDFGPRGLSVQYTQDVRGCPSAHTGRPWLSVCVRVCPSAHTGRPWLSISTHISTLVLGLSTLTLPMDCSGDFGPRGLFVQYTQDVRGCPPAHTGRPWLSVAVCQHTQDVCGCPCVSGCVRVCPSAHTGRPWLSISTHISTLVLGLSTLTLPVDCSGDFVPRGLSVRYTQDVRGCPPAHAGRPWLSVSTHRTSVCVRQHTQDVCGCPCVSEQCSSYKEPQWVVCFDLSNVVYVSHRLSSGDHIRSGHVTCLVHNHIRPEMPCGSCVPRAW
ncbi:hypothetical protein YC2023_108632 [Brassica napus]